MEIAAYFAGATAVEVLVYKKALDAATVFELGGPLGATIGAAIGFFVALPLAVELMGKDDPNAGLAVGTLVFAASPFLFMHFVGGAPWMEAFALTLGGAAARMAVSKL